MRIEGLCILETLPLHRYPAIIPTVKTKNKQTMLVHTTAAAKPPEIC